MTKLTQDELNRTLWAASDSSRGHVDGGIFKDYILTFLFFKYLSDQHKKEKNALIERFGDNKERLESKLALSRFKIPNGASFDEIYNKQSADNIGELINEALHKIENANEERLKDIFSVDFNSQSVLGPTAQRNRMLRNIIADFAKIDMRDVEEDILGNAYMYMIERFGSDAGKKAGEFFTPHTVSNLLAKLAMPESGSRICDPTCGSGSLLLLTAKEIKGKKSHDYALYGQEKTGATYNMARMNMFLHGEDSARIEWGDTLNDPKLIKDDNLMKFDVVVANPPFSLDKWGDVKLENDQYNRFFRGMPPKSKGDYAFISHMIETAKAKSGRVAVIVPHGVLFRGSSEGKIREALIRENLLDAVIGLPSNLFQTTGIPVAILIFDRSREKDGANENRKNVVFIDASREYIASKAQNSLNDKIIDKIVKTYQFRKEIEKYAHVASPEEMEENGYNLNIPRYVDTFEEEADVDIKAVNAELAKVESELAATEREMRGFLKELEV
ncbi:MAG: type I restriction-modification system subunit M [Rickettsiales bacterium]|jgi:type I restriction enzyme M protein|nr:type I restriction-modification system subunit M [Rickettsiales bacterium]